MGSIKGVDVAVKVNTGTEGAPIWTMIGGQKGATLNRSVETIENTSKSSNGWKEFDYSFKEWGIDADGLLVQDDAGFEALENAFMNSLSVKLEMGMPNGDIYEGTALVTELPIEAPYDDFATYSTKFQGSGALVKTPGA